jgi:hypothetical protein
MSCARKWKGDEDLTEIVGPLNTTPELASLIPLPVLQRREDAIYAKLPDVNFEWNAIEDRRKFRERCKAQIERLEKNTRRQVNMWKLQLIEYEALHEYDDAIKEIHFQMKVTKGIGREREPMDVEQKSSKRQKNKPAVKQEPNDFKSGDLFLRHVS